MLTAIICGAGLLLAFANGANDNFKGVATLFGSRLTAYSAALRWATLTTLAGSCTAVVLSDTLLKAFSGKGLVDEAFVTQPSFAAAVGLGAALTVLAATLLGMPVSTTHALIGALLGASATAGSTFQWPGLVDRFAIPMLVSPLLAVFGSLVVYPLLQRARRACGASAESCLCVTDLAPQPAVGRQVVALQSTAARLGPQIGDVASCRLDSQGASIGVDAKTALTFAHFLSAGAVGFARGLNDTPKIAAILLMAPQASVPAALVLVGVTIAVGGILSARRVAETMSDKITPLNEGQGFAANLVTSVIVIGSSRLGLPVSTTHVSCGALFGIGVSARQARWQTISAILAGWATTFPVGAALGAFSYAALNLLPR